MNCTFTWQIHLLTTNKALASLLLVLVCLNCFGQARYTWQPIAGNNWSSTVNWLPVRTAPATDDVLVFDGAQTPNTSVTLDFITAQTIGQLVFANSVQVALNNDGPRTLIIGAVLPTIGFQVGTGAKVQLVGTLSSAALKVQLAPNVKASIAGRIELLGLGSSGSGH